MSLASVDDVTSRLGRDLTDDESNQILALLADVSDSVELYTGRLFAAAERTLRTRVNGRSVRLPQRPVTAVASVTDIDGNDLVFTWDGIDRVYLGASAVNNFEVDPIPTGRVVDITYTAGPATVDSAIVGVVCAIVLRALGIDPTEGSKIQESVDGYAFSIGSTGGARAYGILRGEAAVLNHFKGSRNASSIRTAW